MAGFAGSQRGDRRRRRLAAETDEGEISAADAPLSELEGAGKRVDAAHTGPAATLEPLYLPLVALVPVSWWKYALVALVCLSLGAAIAVAGRRAHEWTGPVGMEISRLFVLPEAPLARWYSSLLLTLSGQLACLIWWARSKSKKDFNGRYWLWVRVACLWILLSGSLATGAHAAVVTAICRVWPSVSSRAAILLPAFVLGACVMRALSREMSGCRWSRGVLFAAAAAYSAAGGLQLERDTIVEAGLRPFVIQGAMLLGHVGLFFSMWLHARHVVHCTSDPANVRRRGWSLPRPHLQLSRLFPRFRRRIEDHAAIPAKEPSGEESERRARKSVAPGTRDAENSPTTQDRPGPVPPSQQAARHRFRIDGRHDDFIKSAGSSTSEREPGQGSNVDGEGDPPATVSGQTWEQSPSDDTEIANDSEASAETEDAGDSARESLSKPDLRGLSKKQRRRLMQEHRQRERELGD